MCRHIYIYIYIRMQREEKLHAQNSWSDRKNQNDDLLSINCMSVTGPCCVTDRQFWSEKVRISSKTFELLWNKKGYLKLLYNFTFAADCTLLKNNARKPIFYRLSVKLPLFKGIIGVYLSNSDCSIVTTSVYFTNRIVTCMCVCVCVCVFEQPL